MSPFDLEGFLYYVIWLRSGRPNQAPVFRKVLEADGMDVSHWVSPNGEYMLQHRIEGFAKPITKWYSDDLAPILDELQARRFTVFPELQQSNASAIADDTAPWSQDPNPVCTG